MKKVLLYSTITLSYLLSVTSCQNENVTDIPIVEDLSLKTRSIIPDEFDWENADWMPTPPGQIRIPSPWVGQGSIASTFGTDVIEDRLERGGWELLYNSFTTNTSGPLQNPYFILYNKYRGLMRIFLYTTTPFISPSSYIEDCIYINSTHKTRIFDFLISDIINPENHIDNIRQIQPAPFDGSMPLATNKWYMIQYELAYDPYLSDIPYNEIQLVWSLNFYNVINFSMGGELQAQINGTIGNAGGKDWKTDAKDATKKIGTGLLSGIGVSMWERNKVDTDGSNKLGLNKYIFNQIGSVLKNSVSAASKGVFGSLANLATNAIIGTGQVTPTPINMTMSGTIELKGTSSSSGSLPSMPISFWMPGTNIPNSAVGYIPLYNKALGVLNFKGRPIYPIYYSNSYRTFYDDSFPGGGQVRETKTSATVHTEAYFDNYLIINPEIEKIADIEVVKQEILKKEGDYYVPVKQVYEDISYDNIYLPTKTEIVDMNFVVKFVIKITPKNGGDISYIIKTLELKNQEYWR